MLDRNLVLELGYGLAVQWVVGLLVVEFVELVHSLSLGQQEYSLVDVGDLHLGLFDVSFDLL